MRVVCLRRHWKSLREIFRDIYDLLHCPWAVKAVWS
jgi:hypothetical protein